jgi:acetyl-CoA synthetase
MRAGVELPQAHDLSSLRFIASVGEPLNPEAIWWGMSAFGQPIHDNWWQTETGGIMIANFATGQLRPGSMGRPLPGIDAALIAVDDQNEPIVGPDGPVMVDEPGHEGMLSLRVGWPSMFRGYLNEKERYRRCFVGDWYLSGDLAERDADGWYWFVGRADDVIKTSGHLIGPFEVESVLMEHPAVAEAAVIGVPDEVAGNLVKAFVSLAPGVDWSEELRRELVGLARSRLGSAVAPRVITHDQHLPRTRSGKIMRRLLRARELGLPEGDLSTLEPDPGQDQDQDQEAR